MKKFSTVTWIILTIVSINKTYSQKTLYGIPPKSEISEALKEREVLHITNIWKIDALKSDNKLEVIFEAVDYKALSKATLKKGLKITFLSESMNGTVAAKSASEFEAYLDEPEYPGTLVAVNQFIRDINKRDANNLHGSMSYITKSGIKIGYLLSTTKEIAYISLIYSNAEIKAEFSNPKRFFEDFKEYLDIVSKDLYLPENMEKLKKVKKSSQEAKDVIIDDI